MKKILAAAFCAVVILAAGFLLFSESPRKPENEEKEARKGDAGAKKTKQKREKNEPAATGEGEVESAEETDAAAEPAEFREDPQKWAELLHEGSVSGETQRVGNMLRSADLDRVRRIVDHALKTTNRDGRQRTYAMISWALRSTRELQRRQMFVEYLIRGMTDRETAPGVERRNVGRQKLLLYKEDFTVKAKRRLARLIDERGFNLHRVLISGIAEMKQYLPQYRKMADDYISGKPRNWAGWAALLVLARWGVDDYLEEVIERVRRLGVSVKLIDLSKDVAYTRQPEAVEFLRGYVFSKEGLSGGGKARGIGYVVGPALVSVLKGCPLEDVAPLSLRREELEKLRNWLRAHEGEWEFRDSASDWPDSYPPW